MFVIDTNVISETMRKRPNKKVMASLRKLESNDVFTTSITAAELLYGAASFPPGSDRNQLEERIRIQLDKVFAGKILAFEPSAARHYADLAAHRKSIGRPILMADALIAAICMDYGFAVVTRDLDGFAECGIEIINPWDD